MAKSITLGTLRQVEKADGETGEVSTHFLGRVETDEYQGQVRFSPNRERRTEGAPHYLVFLPFGGTWREVSGGAWLKEANTRGGKHLSITIDWRTFKAPIYCKAWPADEQPGDTKSKPAPVTEWVLKWTRYTPKPDAAPAAPDGALDDEIPWS